jgi:hypothetical protein
MRRLTVGLACYFGLAVAAAGFLACSIQNNGIAVTADASVADLGDVAHVVDAPDAGVLPDVAVDAKAEAAADVQADVQEVPQPTCTEQSCGGACCGGQCIPRTCGGCDAGGIFCPFHAGTGDFNGYCVSDCVSCDAGGIAADITCFSCAGAGLAGRCALNSNECLSALDAGACPCGSGDAGECPGATQVCASGSSCLTCGQAGTDGQPCANGKGCSGQNATCNQ